MLLSLILPSYMIVPSRELANTLNSSTLQSYQHHQSPSSINIHCESHFINIKDNTQRGCQCFSSLSINSSREMSINSTTSSMNYIDCIQAQSRNLT